MSNDLRSIVDRVSHAITQRGQARRLQRSLTVTPRDDLVKIGSSYGAWPIPVDTLSSDSVCYLAGLGEDASFDLGLIERVGCTVHVFDPVPEAARYAETIGAHEPRFDFQPIGLWSSDRVLRFYDNAEPGFVSRSATNMHGTGTYFEAQVRSIGSLMREWGHRRIDLLKLSVEGSEYEILGNILAERIPVGVLCVEFAQPSPLGPIRHQVQALTGAGYQLNDVWLRPFNWRLTFSSSSID
ncbi:MAG: FkbM family methyltransferase [Solirubrobacteraceae bacterium]